MANNKNDFLITLLGLQQDGKDAISLPSAWNKDIPLKIETKRSKKLMGIAKDIKDAQIGSWHFLLGSPGNGKSALVGMLFKKLVQEFQCAYRDPDNTANEAVPYRREIKFPGEKFHRLWLIQDASTVRNPYESDVDEAGELARELKEAEKEGVSIIVCANRGILERVESEHRCNDQWFQAIKNVVNEKENLEIDVAPKKKPEKAPFKKVKITFDALDHESILIQSDDFKNLLEKALNDGSWNTCETCECNKLCPFFNNRISLQLDTWKNNLHSILSSVETWSGQSIVFREALTIISYLLAGCPSDYKETHPCDWVFEQVKSNNIFKLLSRRVYYQIFGSQEYAGLDQDRTIREEQLETLKVFNSKIKDKGESYELLQSLIDKPPLKTDVGVERILGLNGIASTLDPAKQDQGNDFYDEWTLSNTEKFKNDLPGLCDLEFKAFEAWNSYQEITDEQLDDDTGKTLEVLNRWSSSFLYRLGGFISNKLSWSEEISFFEDILKKIKNSPDSSDTTFALRDLGKNFTKIMREISRSSDGDVKISSSLSVGGGFITMLTKAKIPPKAIGAGLSLEATFENNKQRVSIHGEQLAWFRKEMNEALFTSCIPRELLLGYMQTLNRLISLTNDYSRQEEDICMKTTDLTGKAQFIEREGNDVRISDTDPRG
jgi:hypothetical protein